MVDFIGISAQQFCDVPKRLAVTIRSDSKDIIFAEHCLRDQWYRVEEDLGIND